MRAAAHAPDVTDDPVRGQMRRSARPYRVGAAAVLHRTFCAARRRSIRPTSDVKRQVRVYDTTVVERGWEPRPLDSAGPQ